MMCGGSLKGYWWLAIDISLCQLFGGSNLSQLSLRDNHQMTNQCIFSQWLQAYFQLKEPCGDA